MGGLPLELIHTLGNLKSMFRAKVLTRKCPKVSLKMIKLNYEKLKFVLR